VGKPGSLRVVHGDDLLYRFFQELFVDDADLAKRLAVRMVASMGIWFPLDVYREWPVLLPWVVRDPTCRGRPARGIPDQWGAPDSDGYLRDDNSLVKALPRSLVVRTPLVGHLHGARMGTEFVASHAWRVVKHSKLASRIPLLNSFVPNLAWLPSQVSKLSDREGGPVQLALQATAWSMYRHAPVAPHLTEIVEEAWAMIPPPVELVEELPVVNSFCATDRFAATRRQRLDTVIGALQRLNSGLDLEEKVVTTRYGEGLSSVDAAARSELLTFLRRFVRLGTS
jgi:hypothetical protein